MPLSSRTAETVAVTIDTARQPVLMPYLGGVAGNLIIRGVLDRQIARAEADLGPLTLVVSTDSESPARLISSAFPAIDTRDHELDPTDSLPRFEPQVFGNGGEV